MVLRQFLIAVLLACTLPGLAAPAPISAPVHMPIDMHHMSWTAREGAPQMVIAMAQTRDGWLWMGNNSGLFRFDGVHFERYTAPGHKFPATAIATLSAFDDGALWIGYRYGGVSVLSHDKLRHYNERDGLPLSAGVWGLERDGEDRLWAATSQGLFRLDGERWRAVADAGAPPSFYKTLMRDRSGRLWAQGNDGVYQLPRGAQRFIKSTSDAGTGVVMEAPDGSVWSWNAPRANMRRLSEPVVGQRPRNWSFKGNVSALMFDSTGDAWVGRLDGLDYHSQLGLQHSGQQQGLSGAWVTAMFEDREGNIWISTATGIDRFRRKRIASVQVPVDTNLNPLAADSEGGVWVGNFYYKPAAGEALTVQPARTTAIAGWGRDPITLHHAADGALWMAPFGELWRKTGTRLQRVELPAKDGLLYTMATDDDGALWASILQAGLYRLGSNGVWQHMAAATGLPDEMPSTIASAPHKGLWLGYPRSRLLLLQDGRWRRFGPADGLNVGMTQVVHLKDAHVWVGGENGVALLHEGRFVALAGIGGVSFEGVSGIVELDNGDLWLNGGNGVFHIEAGEIARLKSAPGYRVHYERLDSLDGLAGSAPARMPVPSMIRSATGQLWLSTTAGVFRLDPSLGPKPGPAPPVQVRAIGQPGQLMPAQDGLRLAQGTTTLQIDYTALALAMPERVNFRYRLDGVDTQWQQVGARRTAYYNNLGPGNYRFSVQATNYRGEWSAQSSALAFSIAPTVTQSWWFRALCVALLLAACWMLYRWRLRAFARQVAARLQERTRERERIARELHDTVLQSVQGLILHVHAAALELPSRDPARQMIEQALQQADEALLEGRDRVRDLRSGEPDEQDLEGAIGSAGCRLRTPEAAPLQVAVSGQPRKLHPLIYDEVLAIATEAIANAYRHAGDCSIAVQLHYDARELRLTIRDDGAGIPPEVVAAGGRSNHWGIRGMVERAERINAKLKLRSDVGSGTEWRLTLSGMLAYQGA